MKTINLKAEISGERLDAFIASNSDISRSHAEKLIADGQVTVNGSPREKKYKVKAGDDISVVIPPEKMPDMTPVEMNLKVVYECEHYAVIDKPAGVTVHPAHGTGADTIVNGLLHQFDIKDDNDVRPGIVHRLDKDTSGLLLVAKNREAREKLSRMFADRTVDKKYLAVCAGVPKKMNFIAEFPIGRSRKDRKKMAVEDGGKYAKSEITVLKLLKGAFLAEVKIYTGRTHQIRVHMSHLGYPLAGDCVYGNRISTAMPISRQALHSWHLSFIDPFDNTQKSFLSHIPEDMAALITILER
ncbi:RluA family pseudouridine synthase [Seleniivibrio woodruffii]|uniref:Pseudouridine synthase n=1 Tax=Seleniivibrio woodruffii TaxID=1078050 RepID=A0A4R1KAX0_9BACT|nr:RluA family pseudouridine synthase [Seleniivibrio woodruffii]TCK61592.1 ribosomal large subunit pseudouridine synthase D [Seleniivibrio woodruffii]TVZ35293.1 23S rRNA pseudouridine1911/1915/1917 synthase [Seleniivibrio woodruffii]